MPLKRTLTRRSTIPHHHNRPTNPPTQKVRHRQRPHRTRNRLMIKDLITILRSRHHIRRIIHNTSLTNSRRNRRFLTIHNIRHNRHQPISQTHHPHHLINPISLNRAQIILQLPNVTYPYIIITNNNSNSQSRRRRKRRNRAGRRQTPSVKATK